MTRWIDRILILALIVVVAVLAATSFSSLSGSTLGGTALMAHMMASGVLVVGLPVFAVFFLRHLARGRGNSLLLRWGYLATLAAGWVAIVTVFLCMLPIPSTGQMHSLMSIHGWAGFMMIPAIAVLVLGFRITQSASRPHS